VPPRDDFPIQERLDAVDRLATIERKTQGTLPAAASLGLAQSTFDETQIARASVMLSRYFDLPPQWFFQVGGVPGVHRPGEAQPMGAFTDPVTGAEFSLGTARRLVRAHEPEVIDRMVSELSVQLREEPIKVYGQGISVEQASLWWNEAAHTNVIQVVDSAEDADFVIRYGKGPLSEPIGETGMRVRLARTKRKAGVIVIPTDPDSGAVDPRTGEVSTNLLAHELGHALGLEHPPVEGPGKNIMGGGSIRPTEREGKLVLGMLGGQTVDSKRVAEAVRALAPLRGDELPFGSALAFALDVAESGVDIAVVGANLRTTSEFEGLDPLMAAEIARRAATEGVALRSASDVATYVAPKTKGGLSLTEPIRKIVVQPRGEPKFTATTRGAAALGPLASQEGFEQSGPLSGLKAEYEMGQQIVAGLTMPGDFFDSLQEANDDYIAAGKEIAERVKIPFSDSWFGKGVGTLLDWAARPLDVAARFLLDPDTVFAPFEGIETDAFGRPKNIAQFRDSPIGESAHDSWDILRGRTTAMEELERDVGIPPWLTLTAELFLGFYVDPIYLAAHGVSKAHAARTVWGLAEAGKAEQWGARVASFVDGRVRRIGDLRDLSIPQYLVREATRSGQAEKFFGRAVDNFRTYFSAEGLHPLVAERVWRYVKAGQKLKLSEDELVEGVRTVLLAGLGVAPPPNTLAAHIGGYVEAIRARSAEQLPLFLADGARYEAGTTRLTHDAATALGALDDAYLDLATRGPRMLEIPHVSGPITRAELALRSSRLSSTALGRGMRNIFTGSPRVAGAHLEISIEQGAEAVRDFRRTLVRSQVYSADDIERGQLELANAMRPSNPYREADFVKTMNRWNQDMLGRIGTFYGFTPDDVDNLIGELERRLGRGMAAKARVFGIERGEGVVGTISEPLLPSQAVNTWQMIDPMVFRRGIAETIGTWRKWRAAHLQAFGAGGLVPPARKVTIPLRRFMDTSLDLVTRDLFLIWWKSLVVLRPAYVLRVVGIEEQARFLSTVGIGRRLRAGKILTGERTAEVLEGIPTESRLMSAGQAISRRVLPAESRAELAADVRRIGQIELDVPELAEFGLDTTLRFPRPGHLPDEALANTIRNQLSLATPGPAQKAMREWLTPGNWGAIDREAPQFLDFWYNALGHQFGLDPVGRRYLDDIARGVDEEDSVRQAMAFLTSQGDGLRYAKRIMGPGYTREALEVQVRRGVNYARDLTHGHPELAGAARDGMLSPEMLRAVPRTERPMLVHGPLINESVLARVGPFKRGRDFVARWIVEQPTNRLTRQPYFKTWYDRMFRSLVETDMAINPASYSRSVKVPPALEGTRVLDDAGNPLRVYHGTANEFERFDPSHIDPGALYGPGYYFTDNPGVASGYSQTKAAQAPLPVRFSSEAEATAYAAEHGGQAEWGPFIPGVAPGWQVRIVQAPNVRTGYLRIRRPFDVSGTVTQAEANRVLDAAEDLGLPKAQVDQIRQSDLSLLGDQVPAESLYRAIEGHARGFDRLRERLGGLPDELIDEGFDTFRGVEQPERAFVNAALDRAGFDGLTYPGGLRRGGVEHQVWVAFHERQIMPGIPEFETSRLGGLTPEKLDGFRDSARGFAVGQVQRIMFDFSREGRIDQLTRHFLVFVQPFLEFPIVWSRIIRQNPGVVAVAARLGRTGVESGFLRTDEETGELVVPLSWWAGAAPMLAALTGGNLRPVGQGGGWELSVPLSSFNLFAQSTFQLPTGNIFGEVPVPLPSFNPEAAWGLQQLLLHSGLRADVKTRLSSWLFAYGGIDPSSPGNMLPSYLHHGLAALFPEWFESETNLQQTHFLQLQQAMGLEPNAELARNQGRQFSGLRAFFAAVFPGAPRIEFPTHELEEEWGSYVDELGYSEAREKFLEVHPGLDLITIARTMWNEENDSPVAIPTSAAVTELLSGRGAKKFAEQHPQWTWAIIPHELRDGNIDPGAFFASIASGQRLVLSPEEFLDRAHVQQGWDAYFALNDAWVAWQEAHPEIGEGDPSYIDQNLDYQAGITELRELNPGWAAVAGVISLEGVDPKVLAESEKLSRDPLFQQTETGQWLVKYLSLRRSTRDRLNDVGLHSIRTKTAERLGITGMYDDGVARLNDQYPDGATAYRLFFGSDLEHVLTPGDKAIDAIDEATFNQRITPWWTRYEKLRDAPDVQPGAVVTEGSRGDAFNAIRAYVEVAYDKFDRKTNPLLLRWKAADPTYHQDALVSLSARWVPYMSRFDKDLLGLGTNTKSEALWTDFVQLRGQIADREAFDPDFSSTQAYEALGVWIAQNASRNKTFAKQVAATNEWGYALGVIVDTPRLQQQLFGTEIKLARPYWRAVLDATSTIQGVVDQGKLGGSYDPKAKAVYNVLRSKLVEYVGQLKKSSAEFSQQWDLLEETNGSDVLVATLMPEFSSYFGPIQGYPGD